MKSAKYIVLVCILGLLFLVWFTRVPLKNRDWSPDQSRMPIVTREGDLVKIKNVRNIKYRSSEDYDLKYYDRTYDLRKLKRAWYLVELFTDWRGPAHTLVSFEFEDDVFLSISVEIRKERDESFSAFLGLLRQYEIMYVIADEEDVIKLRTNFRKNRVYLYPMKGGNETLRKFLLDMLKRSESLRLRPEFYNSITNTCTTNLLSHLNKISDEQVPYSFKVLLPGYSDELAYKLGLIDTELSFEEARERFRVGEVRGEGSFSRMIRQRSSRLPGD